MSASIPRRTTAFWLQLAFTLLVCAFLIVPVGLSIMAGVTKDMFIGIASGVTLQWLVKVWTDYRQTVFLSIQIALACLACTLVLGVPAAYVLARRQNAFTRAVEELLVMPVAVPGLATALALIVTYGGWGDFRRSWVFILVGHVLFTLPFMVRSVLAVLSSIDLRTLEEGARSLGASFVQRFFGVVLPNCRGGILAGSLMVVTLSLGEFNMTLLLHTPLTQTLPVGLADTYASLRLEVGSAYTLIFFIIIIPLLIAMQWAAAPPVRRRPVEDKAMSGTAIRLERCGKTFADGTRALDPVDLDFTAGETVVLLGPSGCGKTTTLRIVAGLELPDAGGRVLFDGADVTAVPIERRNVGMVFQSYALFPNMSVEENVAYGLKVRGMPAAERDQRAREMLAMMQIAPLAARSIDQLSGGQRQRVALARALAPRPACAAARRTPDRAGRPPARHAARGNQPAAARAGNHDRVCDARPGRSDGAGRSHRGDGSRPHCADRHSPPDLRGTKHALRGRVHRHDERRARRYSRWRAAIRRRGPASAGRRHRRQR